MAFNKFKKKTFTQLTSSADFSIQTSYRKIPAILRLGKKEKTQGGFFDYKGVIKNAFNKNKFSSKYQDNAVIVVQDNITNETSVLVTPEVFRDSLNGFIEETIGFQSSSVNQISASFFAKIGQAASNMPTNERYISILSSPFEEGSSGSGVDVIGPVTASVKVTETPGIAFDVGGILRTRKITYENSSTNFTNSHFFFNFDELNSNSDFGNAEQSASTAALVATGLPHLTRSFTGHFSSNNPESKEIFYYVQEDPVEKFSIEMTSSNNTASFFALTSSFSGSADFGVISGSFIGKIIESSSIAPRFYNGTNPNGTGDDTDGSYLFVVQKGIVEGEGEFALGETSYGGDTGTNVAFTPQQMVVWYPTQYNYSNVRSASFYFTSYPENMHELNTGATTKALVTGSISSSEAIGTGELRTVYWLNHTFTSSFTGSFGNFTRDQLKNQIGSGALGQGSASNHQLPYINTSLREFGKKGTSPNSSHLWKDRTLSIPVDEGYYIHSSSFTSQSKANMANNLGSENHTSSFFVIGSFKHPFVPAIDGNIINYTASQEREAGVGTNSFMTHHPIASCIFLKRFDNQVFQFRPKNGQEVISESVG